MPIPVIMPKLEMSQETARVVEWLKAEGDTVRKGEPLLTVETDKVTVDVESPAAGTLAGIRAKAGDVVPVTEIIAHILAQGEAPPVEVARQIAPTRITPVAQRIAAERNISLVGVQGTGVGGKITQADVQAMVDDHTASGKVRATPAARRIAREQNVDLEDATGSGPRGRIQAADLRALVLQQVSSSCDGSVDTEVVPLAGMRRTIAERMTLSYQSAPHITLTVEADVSAVQALRAELNTRATAAGLPRISVTGVLVKACAWALMHHRWVNASLHGDEIHLHKSAHIGVAVALDDGLIVPVIHSAERLTLAEIAAQLSDLGQRAQRGALTPQDVSGGTFTLSNLGMYGIQQFTAILNPPQSAILAVGTIAKRQVVVEQGGQDTVAVRPMMALTLSADHRVLDGAVAASFLRDVVDVLEHPNLMLWR